jgi:glycine betaine transporter
MALLVTSVVIAALVPGIFSSEGDRNASVNTKLSWGVILPAQGYIMILSGNLGAIKSIMALGSLPFVFVVLILVVCLLKTLQKEFKSEA